MKSFNDICAITEASNALFHETRVAALSFIEKNKWFDGTLILLCTEELTKSNISSITSVYSKVEILQIRGSELEDLNNAVSKKRDTLNIIDYLFIYSFLINSKGNIYFSRNIVFIDEISNILSVDSISAPFNSNIFNAPNLMSDVDYRLMYIPSNYIDRDLYIQMLDRMSKIKLYLHGGDIIAFNALIRENGIKLRPLPPSLLVRSSTFPDVKYKNFIRYLGSISAIIFNTRNLVNANFNKIHSYWKTANSKYLNAASNPTYHRDIENTSRLIKSISKSSDYTRVGKYLVNEFINTSSYCLFISLTDEYVNAFRVFIHSFLKHNLWFDGDIVIMNINLTEDNLTYVKSLYYKSIIVEPEFKNYIDVNISKLSNSNFINNYYKLDIFTYTKYSKIVSMDCDMLIQGDLSDLFNKSYGFGAVPMYPNWTTNRRFNGGLIVLDSGVNNLENYKKALMNCRKPHAFAEQDVLNNIFPNFTRIDKTYNSEKRMLKSKDKIDVEIVNNAKVIHYVGGKPWTLNKRGVDLGFDVLENKWKYANRKKIVIVGNSPSVLNNEAGSYIDSFDIVIRLNDFNIVDYRKYVGTKITSAFCTFATVFTDEYYKLNSNQIYMSTSDRYGDLDFLKNRVDPMIDLNNINILDEYYYSGLNKKLGLTDKKRCSTGTLAIEYILNNFISSDIYIHGIDLRTDMINKENTHYFKKKKATGSRWINSIAEYHDFNIEFNYVNSLINNNIIKKLI